MTVRAPLEGIRVIDAANFLAAPFCGTILADFGADVIKIEQPKVGDALRRFGTMTECGDTLVWLSEARNKRSMTLDLRAPDGAEIFKQLVASADVVLENFRPGTLEKWGLGYDVLKAINPKLVLLRVSAYGQTGPMKGKPGFARVAHAFSGLAFLAGEAGRMPVMPGSTSLADYVTGMWGALGVMMALRVAERDGVGQAIDIGLYESIFRLLDEIAPAYERHSFVRERMGADTINIVPHSHYQASDGGWVAIACSTDKMWERLCVTMGRPELAEPSSPFGTMADRLAQREETNAIVQGWIGSHPMREILDRCDAGDVPCGPLYSIADIFQDPQFKARGNLQKVESRAGCVTIPQAIPQMSETPPVFRHAGPALGSSTDEILSELLGLDAVRLDDLRARDVI